MRYLLACLLFVAFVLLLQRAVDHELAQPNGALAAGAQAKGPPRTLGYGLISMGGKGAEAWRYEYVKEKRKTKWLQQRLTVRVLEVRRLKPAADTRGTQFFSWLAAADCVHSKEGAWHSNTGNGYFGGMQADRSFQSAYGPQYLSRWGLAHTWPWWAQLHMAYNGWLARGWNPWPNTARACGLL